MNLASLVDFAVHVRAAMAQVDAHGRFGSRKVFISSLWETLDPSHTSLNLETFKARLLAAHRAQLLSLARADLVAAMPAAKVAASEIDHGGVSFHFVVDPQARDAWG